MYALSCVLISIHSDDEPSMSKHEAINTTNEVVLIVFISFNLSSENNFINTLYIKQGKETIL